MVNKIVAVGLCSILLIAFSNPELKAQTPPHLNFSNLSVEDGLSQSSGQVIFQDSQGYMWFGTSGGLNKYNGYDITIYQHNPADSGTVSGNAISFIYEDSRNNLWVGTTGAGLNLFNRDKDRFSHFKISYNEEGNSISDNSITGIEEQGTSGNLWIGTYNGLNFFDRQKGKFIHYFAESGNPGSLSSSYINCLYKDREGRLWVGTRNGLNLWDNETKRFSHFVHDSSDPNSISSNDVINIYEDRKGNFWIGTTNGLNRFDRDTGRFYRYLPDEDDPASISGNSIFSIFEDSRGALWIGTENNGLNYFDRESGIFHHYKQNLDDPNSISNNAIYSIYENNDQILWVGTYNGGIDYVDRKKPKFELYQYEKHIENPLSANSVTAFLEDGAGNFWVGTDGGGLNRFNRETGEFFTLRHDPDDPNSLASDVVLALLQGDKDEIWIGYYHGGVSRYDPVHNRFRHYEHKPGEADGLCHNDVFALYKDKKGNIWIGTNGGGVCRLDTETGRFTHYQAEEGVIRDILIDSENRFWLGTYGGGLKLLDRNTGGVWNFYEGDNGLRSNVVLTVHEDKAGNFWLGTKEGGLHLFDRDSLQFTSFDMTDGLPSNEVKGILEDEEGNLWLSTNNGLSKFDPETHSFFNYSVEHGLQGREFNTLAYYKDRQGYMYFGGINGFNRFHPDSLEAGHSSYPAVFTDFKIFNKSVTPGKDSPLTKHISQTSELVLPYSASVLTFEYAALNFNEVKGIRYSYMLEGFEQEWNHVGDRRSATYTNLSPGNYTLKVRTSNSDGVWNEEALTLAINITPPFWRTTWFYLLSGLAIAGLIFGIYRYRVKSITRTNKQLAAMVTDRTSQLRERNKDLNKALKDLEETREELLEKARKAGMAEIATGVLHNIGNVLNSISTSTSITGEILENSKIEGFFKANELLREHSGELGEFLVSDPKGKKLPDYYLKLEEPVKEELKLLRTHTARLEEKVKLINEVISTEQSYASLGLEEEESDLQKVFEDSLTIYANSLERHNIEVIRHIEDTDPVFVQKTKLVHVVINILKNAKDAIIEAGIEKGKIIIEQYQDENNIFLKISDNGAGIKKEHMNKIFTHGFTTKKKGHGFGLHSCANYMTEMGGKIEVKSEGEGKGATFSLIFQRVTDAAEGKEALTGDSNTSNNYEESDKDR